MQKLVFLTRCQLAARYSLAESTIDNYVAKGLLTAIHLDDGTFFSSRACAQIEIIEKGKRLGFSLAEIKSLMDVGRSN